MTPTEAVSISFSNSLCAYTAKWNGEIFAYWGYAPASVLGITCQAWMLTTPLADEIPLILALTSRRIFTALRQTYPVIIVEVDPAYSTSLRWLRWLGFREVGKRNGLLLLRADRKRES